MSSFYFYVHTTGINCYQCVYAMGNTLVKCSECRMYIVYVDSMSSLLKLNSIYACNTFLGLQPYRRSEIKTKYAVSSRQSFSMYCCLYIYILSSLFYLTQLQNTVRKLGKCICYKHVHRHVWCPPMPECANVTSIEYTQETNAVKLCTL